MTVTTQNPAVVQVDSSVNTESLTHVTRYKVYTQRQFDKIEPLNRLSQEQRFEIEVVANVLPFSFNEYLFQQLINCDKLHNDLVIHLTFPQRRKLAPEQYAHMANLIKQRADRNENTQQ